MYIFDTSSCLTFFIKLRYYLYSHVELITSSCYNLISSLLGVSPSHHNRKCCLANLFFDLLIFFFVAAGVRCVHEGKFMEIRKQLVWVGSVLCAGFEDGIQVVNLVVSTSPAELLSSAPLVKLCQG